MTLEEIAERVAQVKTVAGARDFEHAHTLEDNLVDDVLTVIAAGASNAQELAQRTMEALRLDFPRWYG